MIELSAVPQLPAYLTLVLLGVMFVLFVLESYAVEVTAMLGAATVVVLGIVPADGILEVFANPAPWTIAAMFIVSAGLVRTGFIGSFAWFVSRRAADNTVMVICLVGAVLAVASAFTNNTPLVAVMIPVKVQIAHAMGLSPSKLLIPLSELLSNDAVAVIVTPVAISLAESLGLDPRPLVVAVMFAATLAFATSIGYQTNTMVYAPGGYRFTDFTRIGLPLNIITGITACCLIPLIWPL